MVKIYFNTNLEYLRKRKKWTQLELANKLGVTEGVIAHWEHGRRQPATMEMVGKIAELFGVGPDIIFKDLRIDHSTDDLIMQKINSLDDKEKKVVVNVIDSFRGE